MWPHSPYHWYSIATDSHWVWEWRRIECRSHGEAFKDRFIDDSKQTSTTYNEINHLGLSFFLPRARDALLCKVRSCDRMSSVCLSVRPTVTLADCDHIGWNSSETISQLVSLGCSLSADPNIRGLLQGEHPKILAQSDQPCWFEQRRHSIANCSRMVTDSATVTITINGAYRKPSIFRMVPPLTPYDLLLIFHMPPRYANGHISATGDPIHFMFGSRVGFSGSSDRMALFPITSNPTKLAAGRHLG